MNIEDSIKLFFLILTIGFGSLQVYQNYSNSINFPLNPDDSVICLSEISTLKSQESSRVDFLKNTKNNHPQIIQRILTLLDYKVTGKVNFIEIRALSLILTITLCLLFLIFIKNNTWVLFILLASLSFHPNIDFWVSAKCVYIYPYLFGALAYLLMLKTTRISLILFFTLLMLSILSFGNGIGMVPLLFGILFFSYHKKFNDSINLWSHTFTILFALSLYLTIVPSNENISLSLLLTNIYNDPMKIIEFIIGMTVGVIKYINLFGLESYIINYVFFIISLIYLYYYLYKQYILITPQTYLIKYFPLFIAGFCIISSILGGIGRAYALHGSGLAPRYEMNSLFFMASLSMCSYSMWNKRSINIHLILLLITISPSILRSIYSINNAPKHTMYNIKKMECIATGQDSLLNISSSNDWIQFSCINMGKDVRKSIQLGLFEPPKEYYQMKNTISSGSVTRKIEERLSSKLDELFPIASTSISSFTNNSWLVKLNILDKKAENDIELIRNKNPQYLNGTINYYLHNGLTLNQKSFSNLFVLNEGLDGDNDPYKIIANTQNNIIIIVCKGSIFYFISRNDQEIVKYNAEFLLLAQQAL